jgi:hypothetical protein
MECTEKSLKMLRYHGNSFTELLPSNEKGKHTGRTTDISVQNPSIFARIPCHGNVFIERMLLTEPFPFNVRENKSIDRE